MELITAYFERLFLNKPMHHDLSRVKKIFNNDISTFVFSACECSNKLYMYKEIVQIGFTPLPDNGLTGGLRRSVSNSPPVEPLSTSLLPYLTFDVQILLDKY